ncbi:MAG TPA: DoxX family protein [Candidatus Limnocylindria bacterium]|nr:DoxX family protein [Candidatus Limnocylindria bacterium]
MTDLARLIVRLVMGGLLAGHGAQKLFGWFGGGGPEGTAGMMESLEMRPAHRWAFLAGASEFGGGILTALGALNPLGPLGIIGSMTMATTKVHWGKPIWTTSGGAELPLTNLSIATALMIVGPGRFSVDHALGIRLPRLVGVLGLIGVALTVGRAMQPAETPLLSTGEEPVAADAPVAEPTQSEREAISI